MLSVLEKNEPGKGEENEEGWDSSSKLQDQVRSHC